MKSFHHERRGLSVGRNIHVDETIPRWLAVGADHVYGTVGIGRFIIQHRKEFAFLQREQAPEQFHHTAGRAEVAKIALGRHHRHCCGDTFEYARDRLRFGAVADFYFFHVGSFEWYVFNIADACIVAGVIGMILAWTTERRQNATEA